MFYDIEITDKEETILPDFNGFSKELPKYFKNLMKNNSKQWSVLFGCLNCAFICALSKYAAVASVAHESDGQ
jgi:epoxyqueuosine reductase QueG